ncbi:MAG TPA: hypothetical protein VKZ98_01165 [Aquaticitalea sp.]|nr:hypothetical protein [Aquaticitalea sp.]
MTTQTKHLYNLDELSDYKVSDGYPDVRGWAVKDIDNRVIGKVDNLMVNKDIERVVYLDVEVDKTIIDAKHDPYGRPNNDEVREFVNKDGDNHIIIPIGLVDLNTDSNYVYTDILDHRTFAETRRYRKGETIDRAYEVEVLDSYGRHSEGRPFERTVASDRRTNYESVANEERIREIVREEIHSYHNPDDIYSDALSDEELEMQRRRHEDIYDDNNFYDRREFENERFKKRTPGL